MVSNDKTRINSPWRFDTKACYNVTCSVIFISYLNIN